MIVADGGEDSAFLQAALSAESSEHSGIRLTPYRVTVVSAERLASVDLTDTRALVLANVEEFSDAMNQRISEYVRTGGGVLAFVGGRADVDRTRGSRTPTARAGSPTPSWSLRSTTRRGSGAIPGRSPVPSIPRSASCRRTRTPVWMCCSCTATGDLDRERRFPEEDVLARLNDAEQTPAVVERRFGSGRVIAVNTGAGRSWSNFPQIPPT